MESKRSVLLVTLVFVIAVFAAMSILCMDTAYAITPDATNYDLKAQPTAR